MECIARVREVAGADLAEALEGRAAISDFDRLVRNGAASPLQEASNIPLVQLHLWEVCCVRPAGLRIGLHRRHYLPAGQPRALAKSAGAARSEEHTSELQSLMRISYAVFCLKKKNNRSKHKHNNTTHATNNNTNT